MERLTGGMGRWVIVLLGLAGMVAGGASAGAQDDTPARPSHIHGGDCDEPGEVIRPLTSLTVPSGEVAGNSDAVLAEAAFTTIPLSLPEMLEEDHSLKVHLSAERIETYLACGDIGGAVDANGALIVGLKELDGSGYTGIAYLVPSGSQTLVSVMIAQVLPTDGRAEDGGSAGQAGADADSNDADAAEEG